MALRNIGVAVASALFAAMTFNILHNKPRKKKYRDFYRSVLYNICWFIYNIKNDFFPERSNYDPQKSFMRMAEGGYLHGCPPCSLKEDDENDADKKKKK